MNTEIYEYAINNNNLFYGFYSVGEKGIISKVVIFQKVARNHFNLAFGDYNELKDEISDTSITNNGDTIKVLGTVIQIILAFFKSYPYAILDITGSTPTRMKLYQRIIKNNKTEIETEFSLLAFKESDYEPQLPDFLQEYQAFQITKKY